MPRYAQKLKPSVSMFATTNKSPSADETEPCHAHDHHYISKYQSFGTVAVIILVTMVLAVFDAKICKFCRVRFTSFWFRQLLIRRFVILKDFDSEVLNLTGIWTKTSNRTKKHVMIATRANISTGTKNGPSPGLRNKPGRRPVSGRRPTPSPGAHS